MLCTLEVKDKLLLFVQDTLDPVTFLNVGFNAGLDQAQNADPTFGQGAEGYGKRLVRILLVKPLASSSKTSPIRRYFRRTHVITVCSTPVAEEASSMPWIIYLWRIVRTAGTRSMLRNGSGRQAQSR